MKESLRISSTFFLISAMLFCTNRLFEAITSVGLTTAYHRSGTEIFTYLLSLIFLLLGILFLSLSLIKHR